MVMQLVFLSLLATPALPPGSGTATPVLAAAYDDEDEDDADDGEDEDDEDEAPAPRRRAARRAPAASEPDALAPVKAGTLGCATTGGLLAGLGLCSAVSGSVGGVVLTTLSSGPVCLLFGCSGVACWGGVASHLLLGLGNTIATLGGSVGSAVATAAGARKLADFRTPVAPLVGAALVPLALGSLGSFLLSLPGLALGSYLVFLSLPYELIFLRFPNANAAGSALGTMVVFHLAAGAVFAAAGVMASAPMVLGAGSATGLTALVAALLGRQAAAHEEDGLDWFTVPAAGEAEEAPQAARPSRQAPPARPAARPPRAAPEEDVHPALPPEEDEALVPYAPSPAPAGDGPQPPDAPLPPPEAPPF